jgi:predicted DNA-binding protein (MmcQ/YjbR family)
MRPKQRNGSQPPTGQTGAEHRVTREAVFGPPLSCSGTIPGMTSGELRAHCLAMPGAVEEYPFGPTASVFKVGGKIFAIASLAGDPLDISVKCEPELSELLRAGHEAIVPGYHLNKRHWITVRLGSDAPDALVRDLVEDSYDLVRPRRKEIR